MKDATPDPGQADQVVLRELHIAFATFRPMLDRCFDFQGTSAVAEGSSLADDDNALRPFFMSAAVPGMLLNAADHVDTVRTLVFEAKVLPSRSPYTLLRCALESASVAVWLLAPPDRDERVLRRLRWAWADIQGQDKTFTLVDHTPLRSREEHKETLQALARAAGLSQQQISRVASAPVGLGEIVASAATDGGVLDGPKMRALWSMCSAVVHGHTRSMLPLLGQQVRGPAGKGRSWVRLTASEEDVLHLVHVTLLTMEQAWAVFDQCRH